MRNKLLTRILAGVTAFALVAAGFTTIGTKKVSADEKTETVLAASTSSDLNTTVSGSWQNYGYFEINGVSEIAAPDETFVKLTFTNVGSYVSQNDEVDFDTFVSWGDQSSWFVFAQVAIDNDWSKVVQPYYAEGSSAATAFVYLPVSNFTVNNGTICLFAQSAHVPATLSKVELVTFAAVDVDGGEAVEEEDPVVPAPTDPANEDEEEDATNAPVVDDEEEEVVVTETEAETVKKPEKVAVTKVPQTEVVTTTTHIAKDEVITPNIKLDPNKEASKLYQIPLDEYAKKGLTITKVTANFGGDGSVKAFYEANYWFGAGPSIGYSSTNDKGWNQVDQNIEATDAFSYSVNPADIFVAEGSIVQIGLWWAGNPNIAVSLDSVVLSVEGDVTETQEIVTGYKYYLVNEDGSLGDEITEDEYNAIVKKNGEVEADTDVTTGAADMVSVWMILAFAGAAVAATVFGFTFRKREEN